VREAAERVQRDDLPLERRKRQQGFGPCARLSELAAGVVGRLLLPSFQDRSQVREVTR
jgi:hypothetical protein